MSEKIEINREAQSESEKFDKVVRKMISVSREELEKREKQWKQNRARAKKKRAPS